MSENGTDIFTYTDASGVLHVVPVDLVTGHEDDRTAEVTSFPIEKGANINDHIIQNADALMLEVAQTQSPMPSASRPGSAFTLAKGFTTKVTKLDVRRSIYKSPNSEKLKIQPNAFQPGGLLFLTTAVGNAIGAVTNLLTGSTNGDDISTAPTMRDPQTEDVGANVFQTTSPIDRIGTLHDALINIKLKGYFCKIVFRGKIYPGMILKQVKWTSVKNEVGLGRFSLGFQSVQIVENATTKLPDPSSLRLKPVKTQAKPPKPVDDVQAKNIKNDMESLGSKSTGAGLSSS